MSAFSLPAITFNGIQTFCKTFASVVMLVPHNGNAYLPNHQPVSMNGPLYTERTCTDTWYILDEHHDDSGNGLQHVCRNAKTFLLISLSNLMTFRRNGHFCNESVALSLPPDLNGSVLSSPDVLVVSLPSLS